MKLYTVIKLEDTQRKLHGNHFTKLTRKCLISEQFMAVDLGNPSKDRERSVDTIILIATPDWSNRLSNFENVVETQFESVCKVECC